MLGSYFFFFKQKTAYEIVSGDWSSDVCSSDLAGPAIASLTGDYFPAGERGRVYAYILAGEVAGSAVGFIISGSVASLIDWRVSFVLLAIPGFYLARELWR